MNLYTHMLHRIGRTGRVGNTGRATSFFDERENAGLARSLVKVICCLAMQNASSSVFSMTPCISWIDHNSRRSFLWIKAVKADRSITLILSRFWLTWSSLCRTGLLDIQEEATTDSSASPKFYAAEAVIINFQIKSPMVKMCKMFLSPSCPTLSLTYIKYPTPPGWSVLAEQVKI